MLDLHEISKDEPRHDDAWIEEALTEALALRKESKRYCYSRDPEKNWFCIRAPNHQGPHVAAFLTINKFILLWR